MSTNIYSKQEFPFKIVITGIGGFVGSYAAAHFLSQGFQVYGFDRHGSNIVGATTQVIDILDSSAVDKYIQEINPTHLLHLAAQSSVKKSWDEPEQTRRINVTGTKNLLNAIKHHAKNCIALIVSSAEIYGIPQELPITEETPINPNSPYGESRKLQEELCQEYITKYNLNLIIARSFPHTGPGQIDQFVCSNFAKQIALIEIQKQPPILTVGNLESNRDFTDVRDVVRAYHLLLTSLPPQSKDTILHIFNVCSGTSFKISDILNQLISRSSTKITIVQDFEKMRPSDIPIMLGDHTKLTNLTNWKPDIHLHQTLKEILDWWRKQM